jgi:4-amino-4-deoxy-L-arabinose transferase-like glycosyltransferase
VVEEDRLVLTHPRRPFFARCLPERACPYLALVLILGAAIFHLAYLACDCPLDLAPDEAHYWDWSRHIDFSYYSKGPLVAWLIRLSCELFGAFSERFTGNLMFAIRLPAVVCGNLLLASLYQLTQEVFGRPRLSLAVVAVALTFPLIAAGSMLMTIDSPYTCCWGWALVFAYRAVTGRSNGAWEATGFLVGIGMLAKYNMAAFIPSLALFLATSREHRRLLFSAGFWSMTGITVAAFLPILVWNAQHDWVTFRHVNGLAGGDRSGLTPWGPPAYLAAPACCWGTGSSPGSAAWSPPTR